MFGTAIPVSAPVVSLKPSYSKKRVSEFVNDIKHKKVEEVLIKPNYNKAYYIDKDGDYGVSEYTYTPEIWKELIDTETVFDVNMDVPFTMATGATTFFMIVLAIAVFRMLFSQQNGTGVGSPFNMQTGNFDLEENVSTRFEDVQGIDSAKGELTEIVDFLKSPLKYITTGAKIPKGAILTGKPGTGKTLLARAIAGESSVPFIQCSGSSFVEMFVGVGAKRVREIFELARKNEPCIIFIDEIDAIGKKRGGNGLAANDEREQTINQLLTEMDGFDNNSQIVVIAATNRVDILDDALLRPGRFDRKIQVSLPDVRGREKILRVHSKNKNLDETVSLRDVAKQTTGFTGADLENLMNESAIKAADTGIITNDIVEDAFQRVVVGAKGDTVFSEEKKRLVAYHEAGHAIIGALSQDYDTVRKVSIIPRGDAGGVTFFQPSEDNADSAMYTREYLVKQIMVALGGRAAEEIVYGPDKVTTGASSDYAMVYTIAKEMVTTYGFGTYKFDYRDMSNESKYLVDKEISTIVDMCYAQVIDVLNTHRDKLEFLKDKLIEEEIIDGACVYQMFTTDDCSEFECSVDFT